MGNNLASKLRTNSGPPRYYGDRAKSFIALCEKHNAIQTGHKVLEIGTGWVHLETIILRYFYDVEATMFDIEDIRQLDALKLYSSQLKDLIFEAMDLTEPQKQRMNDIAADC